MINHTGTETRPRLQTEASSEEFWTMSESLIQQYYVGEEGSIGRKPLSLGRIKTVPKEEAPANFVPAAAVIRRERALSGLIGRKGSVGGLE